MYEVRTAYAGLRGNAKKGRYRAVMSRAEAKRRICRMANQTIVGKVSELERSILMVAASNRGIAK